MTRKTFLSFLFLFFIFNGLLARTFRVSSPNNILQVEIMVTDGIPYYKIYRFNRELISKSRLGFRLKEGFDLSKNFIVKKVQRDTVDTIWTQVWGEKHKIRNHYHELTLYLEGNNYSTGKMILVFRVFDDGVGFRYIIPSQRKLKKIQIMDELTQFSCSGDYKAWWIPAYKWNRYEYLYKQNKIHELDTVHTPLTMETPDGVFLSIHEAALTDYASMTLAHSEGFMLEADLVPWWDGVKVRGELPLKTPWRTIQIADDPGGLITSYLILNLNEPNQLKDVSWIKPGKYVGIWWEMHLGISTWSSGPKHGATTENAKKYIDFAAQYGFDGVLVEGWNIGWDGNWMENAEKFNFLQPYPDFDLEEVTHYAKEKGVYLIGHNETATGIRNYEKQMEDAFNLYAKLGIRLVKTGYVGHGRNIKWMDRNGKIHYEWHHGQFMVRHYRKVVQTAAKYHLMIIAHEPIKATGIRRTFPNMMSREGARGQEYNAWSRDGGNPPEHTTILPFTRLLGGPMDFTPGIFDLTFEKIRPHNRVNTTLAKQLALYVVIYSPFQMAADLPENYQKRLDAFQFIRDVPTDWEDTKVLNGRIGDYITIVRQKRNSNEWFLGSLTDEHGRILETPLYFLHPGTTYVAEIYRDSDDADWQTNPYGITIEKKLVTSNTIYTIRLAPGGGQAIRFRPANEEEIKNLPWYKNPL